MSAPLYFLPDIRAGHVRDGDRLRASVIEERGLAHVFADIQSVQREVSIADLNGNGPGSKSGCLLCALAPDGRLPEKLGYYPQAQQWHEWQGHWIGIATAQRPGPDELSRRRRYGDYMVTLADGKAWQIATARRPDDSTELPRTIAFDAAGDYQERIKSEWQQTWERTGKAIEWFESGFENSSQYRAEILDMAIAAVGINYRFGRGEQHALGLIDSDNWLPVLCALVDWYAVQAGGGRPEAGGSNDQKKTDNEASDETVNSSPGAEGSCPATDPAEESCTA